MKKSLLPLFLLLSVCLGGQVNFQISQMTNPNPPGITLFAPVIIGNEAFASGSISLYHNGSQWVQLSGQKTGLVSGIKKANGDIYALTIPMEGFFSWNNTTKSWESAGNKPYEMMWGAGPFVVSDTSTWWTSEFMDKGELWHYNGVNFTKKLSDTLMYYSLQWADSSGVWIVFQNRHTTAMAEYGLVFYDGATLHHLCDFPPDRGRAQVLWTNDGVLFFIHTVLGDVYLWNNSTQMLSTVFNGVGSIHSGTMFATSDNKNIFTAGSRGVRHIWIDNSNVVHTDTFQPWVGTNPTVRIRGSYYKDGRAILVGSHGLIYEIQFITSVNEPIDESLFNIYPNPSSSQITLQLPVIGVGEKRVEIFNSSGQLMTTSTFQSVETRIDISGLSNGVYFVRLTDKHGRYLASQKLVKEQ